MELDAQQAPLSPFGTYACQVKHTQHMELGGRPSLPSSSVSSRSPAPCEGSRGVGVSSWDSWDLNRAPNAIPSARSCSKSWTPTKSPYDSPQKMEARFKTCTPCVESEEQRAEANLPKHSSTQPELPSWQQRKRIRTLDDVDGPGTAALSCKKRRLLLHLVTSRLSRPFSLPATHILIRESGDNMPVLHRIQQLAALGARRSAGNQGALLVRKAAILNRVRIGVRKAAVSRGHTIMADLAARYNALNHGLLLVTTPTSATFTVANVPIVAQGHRTVPPIWRPHTTSFHPPIHHGHHQYYANYHPYHQPYHQQQQHQQHQKQDRSSRSIDIANRFDTRQAIIPNQGYEQHNSTTDITQTEVNLTHKYPSETAPPEQPRSSIPTPIPPPADAVSDEEDNTAFPAASFRDRYADLSDDDMDDVYADFGVLFGSGARSPDRGATRSPAEEQFYEEYLDELDGIPWVV
ncbi:hypothetical protein F5B22DRAFT_295589 [Xylaria bambusicola]|uniref:uncharacterized protein n=1 Tax=Xylaria bambusicola TaxID=326684 RepID=UPI002008CB4B|nr:uncharacterized protein F5B22DRAFT_295589 [Xylaria bambusicola]KAI0512817.1 hypothetical protein F5B22DRAFT_295589 [Xylaria bambusicola]